MTRVFMTRLIVRIVAVLVLSAAVLAGPLSPTIAAAPGSPPHTTRAANQTTATDRETQIIDLVERVTPAVVTVINLQTVSGFPGTGDQEAQAAGSGTGFIIDDEGYIVTNWHVVVNGESFRVVFADGSPHDAELIGADPRSDLAVVKVSDKVPAVAAFGDSDKLKPGQTVLAIGSPLGAFTNTVTEGIVGGLGRNEFIEQGGPCQAYTNLIQHDAAINPGNSGGPLFNLDGEVVGVNTLGIPVQNGVPVQGLFFAIPSNTAKDLASQIIEDGQVDYPYLGVVNSVQITPELAAQADLPIDYGLYVPEIEEGGPADQAGMEPDDVILTIDGVKVSAQDPLTEILLKYKPGDTIEIVVLRGDEEVTLQLELGTLPEEALQDCQLPSGP